MRDRRLAFVPVLLAAQAVLVYSASRGERPPAAPDLSRFPSEFSGWKLLQQTPIAPDVEAQLRADRLLSRVYIGPDSGSMADLFVAWFESQRAGASQPHSPKVCLPGSGWTPESAGTIDVPTPAGPIAVNRYVVAQGPSRAVVLYWYQTPRRAIASEWSAKFWVMADALRDRRTDTALVRIVVWSAPGGDAKATATARKFAADLYPVLRHTLPI